MPAKRAEDRQKGFVFFGPSRPATIDVQQLFGRIAANKGSNSIHGREPDRLGLYWAVRGEFNAARALQGPPPLHIPLALPTSRRVPCEMHFRAWDGAPPTAVDDWGIACVDGPVVVPDVVLVPCVGYTRSGWRLGYGGGYFDRWLAAHPHATAVGVAWSVGEIAEAGFAAEPHDVALTLVVNEAGVVR